jgi:shikimate dehydrogenase
LKKFERFAVIGDPIAHSLSPVMQSAAFKAAHLGAIYEGELVAPSDLGTWVLQARRAAYAGFNVTIPHKETIAVFLDELDDSVRTVGAVNTVVNQAGTLIGYNTDLPGFIATARLLHIELRGRQAVVLGAGGSARAVLRALEKLGAHITLCNRSEGKARTLASQLSIPARTAVLPGPEAKHAIETADILVNTTPLGMSHLPFSPLPHGTKLDPRTTVIDLVYGPTTPLVRQARAAGCVALDGIEMLVQQGAAAFQLWTGIEPNLEAMRAACRQSLMEVTTCSAS